MPINIDYMHLYQTVYFLFDYDDMKRNYLNETWSPGE